MDFALVYALAVVPVTLMMIAAVRPLRWRPVGLILAGPVVTGLAVLGVRPFADLGWIATLGLPYAVLVIAPLIPWRQRWARVAVPATALVTCAVAVAAAGAEPAVVFYLALPLVLALAALVLALVSMRGRSGGRVERPLEP